MLRLLCRNGLLGRQNGARGLFGSRAAFEKVGTETDVKDADEPETTESDEVKAADSDEIKAADTDEIKVADSDEIQEADSDEIKAAWDEANAEPIEEREPSDSETDALKETFSADGTDFSAEAEEIVNKTLEEMGNGVSSGGNTLPWVIIDNVGPHCSRDDISYLLKEFKPRSRDFFRKWTIDSEPSNTWYFKFRTNQAKEEAVRKLKGAYLGLRPIRMRQATSGQVDLELKKLGVEQNQFGRTLAIRSFGLREPRRDHLELFLEDYDVSFVKINGEPTECHSVFISFGSSNEARRAQSGLNGSYLGKRKVTTEIV